MSCDWSIGNIQSLNPNNISHPIDIRSIVQTIASPVNSLIPKKVRDDINNIPNPDIGEFVADVGNYVIDGVNDGVISPLNEVICGIETGYSDVKADINVIKGDIVYLKQYMQIINDVVNGKIWQLLQLWISQWFPGLDFQSIYYVSLIVGIILLMVVLGGLVGFIKLFI